MRSPRRRTLVLLALATAVGSAGLAAGGTAGALLGAEITGTEAAADLPLGMLVVGQALAAILISGVTGLVGRSLSLALGYVLGMIGAICVILAATTSSFTLLLAGSAVLGGGNTAVFLTRYAAAEAGGDAMRGRALGIVLFAAAIGAVVSPNLLGPGGELARLLGLPPLAGLYVIAVLCFTVAAILLSLSSVFGATRLKDSAVVSGSNKNVPLSRGDLASELRSARVRIALCVLAVTNLVMVAVMAIAPVHLSDHGHTLGLVGTIVAIHVAGMFLPSPVSGWAADRFGPWALISVGGALLVTSGLAGVFINPDSASAMTAVLVTLGLGWNCGVVGGSTMLSASVPTKLRPRIEGIAEVAMGLAAGAGAPAAGVVVAFGGFAALSIISAATIAATMVTFTILCMAIGTARGA